MTKTENLLFGSVYLIYCRVYYENEGRRTVQKATKKFDIRLDYTHQFSSFHDIEYHPLTRHTQSGLSR